MQFDILTLFPEMFEGPLSESIIKIAQKKKLLKINLHNLRKWATDKHRTCDDKPFGGGGGMVMKVEPVYKALKDIVKNRNNTKIILLTPQGKRLNQKIIKNLSKLKRIVLVCGHYEGVGRMDRWGRL